MNNYKNTIVEFHILQSFPVSCLNRDDVGSPKSAYIGGVPRARVSSQCWKRAVRLALHEAGIKLGIRTKKIEMLLAKGLNLAGASAEQTDKCAKQMAGFLSDDSLIFVSENDIRAFCDYAKEQGYDADRINKKDLGKIAKKVVNPGLDALDIALFGRMVANQTDMNIEAAASFSHAISTHKANSEIDFFTALDDLGDTPGSSHMGTLEFNAATYYRYVLLDVGQLAQTLGGDDQSADPEQIKAAVEAFIKALVTAVPAARQKTQAAYSVWDFARIYVRRGQALQVSFDEPVKAGVSGKLDTGTQKPESYRPGTGGFLEPSKERLKSELDKKEKLLGSLFGKVNSFEWGEDEDYSVDSLISDVKKCLE